jgi:4-hydroxy-tetrahydrodipicolinate synthase
MEGYIRRMLWVLAEDGIIPDEACHDPIGPQLDAGERRRVVHEIRSLDALL